MSRLTFTSAAIETLLWAETDSDGTPLDRDHNEGDLSPSAIAKIEADCAAFYDAHSDLLTTENCLHCGPDFNEVGRAGHDFILTRNGHGAGFWDGDWTEPAATILTTAAKAAGEIQPYIGDDGLIYLFGYETAESESAC